MWIISPKRGMVSCVQDPYDEDVIVVRARALDDLQDCLGVLLPDADEFSIVQLDLRDYRWRTFMPRERFVEMVAAMAEEVDYRNVKDAATVHRGVPFHNVLSRVWTALLALDDRPGGWHAGSRYKGSVSIQLTSRTDPRPGDDYSPGFTGARKPKPKKTTPPRGKRGSRR